MLHIVAFINNTAIDRIDIHNTGIINAKGQYKYTVSKIDNNISLVDKKVATVWHKREDGWMRLTEKAIKALSKKGK